MLCPRVYLPSQSLTRQLSRRESQVSLWAIGCFSQRTPRHAASCLSLWERCPPQRTERACRKQNQAAWVCTAKGYRGRPQGPRLAPAGAKSPACGKKYPCLKDKQFGRAHLARQCANGGQSSLGARLRTRKVTGRDASLPAPFVDFFLGVERPKNSWGVAPNPTRDAVPAPCKGHCPLTLFGLPGLVALSLLFG